MAEQTIEAGLANPLRFIPAGEPQRSVKKVTRMFFRKTKDKLKGKPDKSYIYRDVSGKEISGWMPPELLSQVLRDSGAQLMKGMRTQYLLNYFLSVIN